VFLISAGTPVTGWPGKRGMGSNLIGEFKLENGNSVWAVYRTIQMPDLSSLNTSVGGFFKGKGPSDLENDSLRAIVFATEADGSRLMIDCVVSREGR